MNKIQLPDRLKDFLVSGKYRYKVAWGGRGSAKSWSIARMLLVKGMEDKHNILCVREIQKSIKKSVHKLLCDQIYLLGISDFYTIFNDRIVGKNGTTFIFEGLYSNIASIKGLENITLAWVEEAESISKASWEVLKPTVRSPDSEIWISFNPKYETDIVYDTFVNIDTPIPDDALVINMNYHHNPWLPEVLKAEIAFCKRTDMDLFNHIWGGQCEQHSQAQIFHDKWVVEDFTTPSDAVFFHGMDYGFAADPTTFIRCFKIDNTLYIDKAAFWYKMDISELPELMLDCIPDSQDWDILGDAASPESIRYLKRAGFSIRGAGKGAGSIKAGIKYMRGFDKIVIHPDLEEIIKEFRLYKYKVDASTDQITPIIIDAFNHGIDAVRYALSRLIKRGINHS